MRQRLAFVNRARVAALSTTAIGLAVSGCGGDGSANQAAPGGLDNLSNRGSLVRSLSSRQRETLKRATVDQQTVRLMGRREGLSVFVARSTRGDPCFLVGFGGDFRFIACGPTKNPFPSRHLPAIDLSPLSAGPRDRHPRVRAVAGIAADGVARMAVRFVHGPTYVVRVSANTYLDQDVPQRPARSIVALDRRGRVLMTFPLLVPPRPTRKAARSRGHVRASRSPAANEEDRRADPKDVHQCRTG